MRSITLLSLLLIPFSFAGHRTDKQPAVLLEGLSDHHHPVSTKNAEAQKFFDQGLRLVYAFNHDEALRSFEKAAELDPQLAMAYWGMALAIGPNYNLDAEEAQLKAAYSSITKAQALAKNAPRAEQDYIAALAKRYAADPKSADKKQLAVLYKNAMGELAKAYPDDLDAATLYAESMMNLRPWELWDHEGKPAEGTTEIVAVLESVLRRNPDHIGANHYYIHAVEASLSPERALPSAHRLSELAPGAGHLVHMPSHIFLRVGDYAAAARANVEAAAVDKAYIRKFKIHGIYPMMYYSHNLHFLAVAHAMQGRYQDAKNAADDLADHVEPHLKEMPMVEFFYPTPLLIQVRFRRWDDILKAPAPAAKLELTRTIWHFARGLAYAHQSKIAEAEKEQTEFRTLVKGFPKDAKFGERNDAHHVFTIPDSLLAAKLALHRKEPQQAITALKTAIEAEDRLKYMEPADWYIPVRETLGGVLLGLGKPAEAEQVFRADLERNRRNGRSLVGLRESLTAQGKTYAAQMVDQEFRRAWVNADTQLRIEDL